MGKASCPEKRVGAIERVRESSVGRDLSSGEERRGMGALLESVG